MATCIWEEGLGVILRIGQSCYFKTGCAATSNFIKYKISFHDFSNKLETNYFLLLKTYNFIYEFC